MVVTGEKLFDCAARRLCPDDIDGGRQQIEGRIKNFVRRAKLLAASEYVALYMGVALLVLPIVDISTTPQYSLTTEYTGLVIGCLLLTWALAGKRELQNRTRFFTGGRRYAGHLPDSLETLLADLSGGLLPTRRELKAGETDSGAVRTSTGEILSSLIPKETYSNRYALLLLASNPNTYGYVWPRRLFSHTINSTIYVAQEQSETELAATEIREVATSLARTAEINAAATNQFIDSSKQFTVDAKRIHTAALAFMRAWDIADAQENKNTAKMDQWLVGDTDEVFAVGTDAFIKAEIDYKKNPFLETVYRLIFWEGRRWLQKGGLQGDHKAAVSCVLSKLERMPMSPTKGREDFKTVLSEPTITKLLRGYRVGTNGERDITGYFNRDRQPAATTKSMT